MSQAFFFRSKPLVALAALGGALALVWPARQARSDNFVFYLPGTHTVMPLETIGKASYLPLLKVLNLVGTVGALEEKQGTLRVWLGTTPLELHSGENQVVASRTELKLANPVEVVNGAWMVPTDFLYTVLPRLTHQPLEYRVGDRRMFIGNVSPVTFAVRLEPLSNGARLVVEFSGEVPVHSAATNGRWVLLLGGTPVEPLEPALRFQNRFISEVQFDDQDGVPKLVITPASGGLNFFPRPAAEGRVWQADVLEPGTSSATAQEKPPPPVPGAPPPPAPAATAAGAPPAAPAPSPAPTLPAVVLDAGHGGADHGAHSRDGVLEKNLTAQLVDRLRLALEATGRLRVILTRTGDTDPTFDERDITANVARPVAFITFHAGDLGGASPRLMLYTYEPSSPLRPGGAPAPFIPWQRAQQAHSASSQQLAGVLAQQLAHIPGLTVGGPDRAPVRQLRSVNAPAAAIELGSLAPNLDAGAIATPGLEQQIAQDITEVLVDWAGGPAN